jgi:tetratricopeptide (TPR) repeat protein
MSALVLALCVLAGGVPVAARQQPPADRERAAALAAAAEAQAARGNLKAAIRGMEDAERAAPNWPELKVNLAALRSEAGDYAGAIAAARDALEIDADLEGAWFNMGLAQLKSGDATRAAEALGRFSGRPDAPGAARAALGLALFQLERLAESAAELQAAVDAGVRDAETMAVLGRAWLRLNEPERAATAARLLSGVAPGSVPALMLDGDVKDSQGDWVAAEAAYRAAVAANPAAARVRYALGLVLYKQRRYAEAALEFDRELTLNPDYPPALYYRAVLELDRGAPDAALPVLLRLTRLVPGHADAWRDLGRAWLDRDNPGSALTALEQALTLEPEDPRAHYLRGRALGRSGRGAEAQAAFDRAAELNQRARDRLLQRVSKKKSIG